MAVDHENLSRLDLNLLVVFDALLQEGHVTRAATRLGIGQPTMSHHLRRLRAFFDDELFERVPSGIAPTPYARELGATVSETLLRLQTTVLSERRFRPATDVRRFRLGITDGLAVSLLPLVLAEVSRAAPGVTVVSRSADEGSPAALDHGELDLVVGWPEHGAPHHRHQTLCREGFVCLFDPAHGDTIASLDDYLARPQVRVLGRAGGSDVVDEALLARKKRRLVALETGHSLVVPYAVKGTSLVAALPESAARTAATELGLAICTVPLELPERAIQMFWHASRDDDAQRWIRDVVARASTVVRAEALRQLRAHPLTRIAPPVTSSRGKARKKPAR